MSAPYMPCPFCGERDVRMDEIIVGEGYDGDQEWMYRVICECGGSTSFHETSDSAAKSWNRRGRAH